MSTLIILVCALLICAAPMAALALTAAAPAPGSALARYFLICPWETRRHHALYRWLGVRLFKRVLLLWYDRIMFLAHRLIGVRLFKQAPLTRGAWRQANGHHLLRTCDRGAALGLACRQTERFELIHLFSLAPQLPSIAILLYSGHLLAAGLVGLMTAVTSGYPVLHQRDNRARLRRLLGTLMECPPS